MKLKSEIQDFAKIDLRETIKWYNLQKKGLGIDFLAEVKKTILRLRIFPDLAEIRYFIIHTATVEIFPYMVHYYFDQNKKSVIVIGIYHTSRNPKIWNDRLV